MNTNYRYHIKNKKNREKINLKDKSHLKSIGEALNENFKTELDNYRIESNFFEFQLKRCASQQELQNLGKNIVKNDTLFSQIKKKYSNSTQVFSRMPNRYFGYLERVIKTSEVSFLLIFDSVYYGDVIFLENKELINSQRINDINSKADFLSSLSSFTIEVSISYKEIGKYLHSSLAQKRNSGEALIRYDWYSFEENDDGAVAFLFPFEVKLQDSSKEVENNLIIHNIRKLSHKYLVNNLKEYFSLNELLDINSESVLHRNIVLTELGKGKKATFVAVYNVGQALCCAVCDINGCPIIYFDFGVPFGRDTRTCPENLDFCFKNAPAIILSHWDKDHWYGGMKHKAAQDQKWIVPNQKVGIQATQFAYKLWEKNNLIFWDDSLLIKDINIGTIFKCDGPDSHIHNYGIGFIAKTQNNDGLIMQYLLPGDNNYEYVNDSGIKNMISNSNGMVATHHGGQYGERLPMNVNNIPENKKGGKIIYSYGEGNSHNHPSYLLDHSARGWNIKLETMKGDCSLGLISNAVLSSCSVCKNKLYQL